MLFLLVAVSAGHISGWVAKTVPPVAAVAHVGSVHLAAATAVDACAVDATAVDTTAVVSVAVASATAVASAAFVVAAAVGVLAAAAFVGTVEAAVAPVLQYLACFQAPALHLLPYHIRSWDGNQNKISGYHI